MIARIEAHCKNGSQCWLDRRTHTCFLGNRFVSEIPDTAHFALDAVTTTKLEDVARTAGATLSTLVQAAWGVFLNTITGQETVVFGTTVSGRPAEIDGIEDAVGLFINTIPTPITLDSDESLRELLPDCRSRTPSCWTTIIYLCPTCNGSRVSHHCSTPFSSTRTTLSTKTHWPKDRLHSISTSPTCKVGIPHTIQSHFQLFLNKS